MKGKLTAFLLALAALTAPAFATYSEIYNASDLAEMGIDLGGTVIVALVDNASSIVSLGIVAILLGMVGAAIAAVFAIFTVFKRGWKR